MKGQISFVEYLAALTIFITSVLYIAFQLISFIPQYLNQVNDERVRIDAYQISELLANDPGNPINWYSSGLSSGWSYRKPITISNSGSSLTNYQVSVIIDTATLLSQGKIRSDCGDIRFNDNDSTELNHWNETICNSVSTKFWVNVPSIPSGSKIIYVYYGNPSVTSTSNGDNTFLFFDDFNGSYIDTNKWDTSNAIGFSESGGNLTENGLNQYYVQTKTSFTAPVSLRTRVVGIYNPNVYHAEAGFFVSTTNNIGYHSYSANNFVIADGNWMGYPAGNFNFGSWRTVEVTARTTSNVDINTSQGVSSTYSNIVSNEKVLLGWRYDHIYTGYNMQYAWDWILVRSYASPEPTTSIGSEQFIQSTSDGSPRIGLSNESMNKTNYLSLQKINALNSYCNAPSGYENVKRNLGAVNNFAILLFNRTADSGKILINCQPPYPFSSPINTTLRRIVAIDSNDIGELIVQTG